MQGLDLHHHLKDCRLVGEARTPGILVRAGRYPGLIDGEGEVLGELYAMGERTSLLNALDALEEYDPLAPSASLYLRVVRSVNASDGARRKAWVYKYNQPTSGLAVVPDGDWRKEITSSHPAAQDQ